MKINTNNQSICPTLCSEWDTHLQTCLERQLQFTAFNDDVWKVQEMHLKGVKHAFACNNDLLGLFFNWQWTDEGSHFFSRLPLGQLEENNIVYFSWQLFKNKNNMIYSYLSPINAIKCALKKKKKGKNWNQHTYLTKTLLTSPHRGMNDL